MVELSRIAALKQQDYCCSQIIIKMGLEDGEREDNPELVHAAAGLCDGLHAGMVCGILSGAALLIALYEPERRKLLVNELVEWFREEFEAEHGGITCDDILQDDELNRMLKCPRILAATYDKVLELLELDEP
ncbi:MAG TPA: C_GCAxxG_C_C family protein [Clostridia bacterium]|nr:C_GCAxxG_C_C family protein [Clostridia bacterium]